MKKISICLLLIINVGLSVFAQEANEDDLLSKKGLINILGLSNESDNNVNYLVNDVLSSDDINVSEVVSPQLLRSIGGYGRRRATFGARETYYNRNLITLLDEMDENVGALGDTSGYVKELRVIIEDAQQTYISAKALALYGKIILENPPAERALPAYSPERLYAIDAFSAIKRAALHTSKKEEDEQIYYLFTTVAPYIKQMMDKDLKITVSSQFQADLVFLLEYVNSPLNMNEVKELVIHGLLLELKNEAANR